MRYLKLLLQCLLNLFNPAISVFSRIEYSKVSKKAKIYRGVKLDHSEVGDYSYIGPNTKVVYTRIGKFCSISERCYIGLPKHPITYLSTSPIFISKKNGTGSSWIDKNVSFNEFDPVIIGNDVWIGYNVTIVGGVRIGDGAIIGAGAMITKDVPPYAIVGGIPAKIIRYRFADETIRTLVSSNWWDNSECYLKSKINLFQTDDVKKSLNELFDCRK